MSEHFVQKVQVPPPPPRWWLLLLLLLLLVGGGTATFVWCTLPPWKLDGPPPILCPDVRHPSPLVGPLKKLEENATKLVKLCESEKFKKGQMTAQEFKTAMAWLDEVKAFLDSQQPANLTPQDENSLLRQREDACLECITDEYYAKPMQRMLFGFWNAISNLGPNELKSEEPKRFFKYYDEWSKANPRKEPEKCRNMRKQIKAIVGL